MTRREAIVTRGLRLEYLTVGWNSMEALVAVIAGLFAGSIALFGFGLDSVIEVSSGAVRLGRLRWDGHAAHRERAEQITIRMGGISFLALAAYLAYEATASLWRGEQPERSLVGIGLAVRSLMVMPILARAKRRIARGLMQADSRQTDTWPYLSASCGVAGH